MRRYLVVDDNLAFAENLGEILRELGDEARVAGSGAEALQLLAAERFDALITDMRMPKLGGAELVREARRADPGMPAIVVSAWTDDEDLRAVQGTGLLAVLSKPVPIDRLLALLRGARRDGLVAVVDDDLALVENLGEILREEGFSTLSATTLPEVAGITSVPFAALVDLRIPGGEDGEALALLQRQFPSLPCFVITAFQREADLAPAHAVFIKPFDPRELLASLDRLHRTGE